jgi:2-polyprenyl-3-methyl-5-hydroxy-6-metoxy-1,4-benzoquinol methylase
LRAQTPRAQDATALACATCGGTSTRTLYEKSGYAVGQCVRCGLVYANPRAPHAKILGRYTPQYFWNEYLPSLGVTNTAPPDLDRFDARYRAILALLGARAPGRRLLEAGCGAGFFLKAAERAGWRVTGIELSDEAARFASAELGLTIRQQPVEEAAIEPGSFDAAAMFDVIEHLFEPRAVLQALARSLAEDGSLVISTPNFDAASRFVMGVDWAVISPLEHTYYFTENSLRQLLEATGFDRVEFVRMHAMWGPMETMNFRYTHAPGALRTRLCEVAVRLGGFPLARALQRAGRQDALLCFARKAAA